MASADGSGPEPIPLARRRARQARASSLRPAALRSRRTAAPHGHKSLNATAIGTALLAAVHDVPLTHDRKPSTSSTRPAGASSSSSVCSDTMPSRASLHSLLDRLVGGHLHAVLRLRPARKALLHRDAVPDPRSRTRRLVGQPAIGITRWRRADDPPGDDHQRLSMNARRSGRRPRRAPHDHEVHSLCSSWRSSVRRFVTSRLTRRLRTPV